MVAYQLTTKNEKWQVIKVGDNQVVQLRPFVTLIVPPSVSLLTELIVPSSTWAL